MPRPGLGDCDFAERYVHRPGRDERPAEQRFLQNHGPFCQQDALTNTNVAEVIQKRLLAKARRRRVGLRSLPSPGEQLPELCSALPMAPAPTRSTGTGIGFIRSYPFVPINSSCSSRSLKIYRGTTPLKVSTAPWVSVRCWCSTRLPFRSAIMSSANWRLLIWCLKGFRRPWASKTKKPSALAPERQLSVLCHQAAQGPFSCKVCQEFKPTIRNLCVLMLEGFGQDLPELRKKSKSPLLFLKIVKRIRKDIFGVSEQKTVLQNLFMIVFYVIFFRYKRFIDFTI